MVYNLKTVKHINWIGGVFNFNSDLVFNQVEDLPFFLFYVQITWHGHLNWDNKTLKQLYRWIVYWDLLLDHQVPATKTGTHHLYSVCYGNPQGLLCKANGKWWLVTHHPGSLKFRWGEFSHRVLLIRDYPMVLIQVSPWQELGITQPPRGDFMHLVKAFIVRLKMQWVAILDLGKFSLVSYLYYLIALAAILMSNNGNMHGYT